MLLPEERHHAERENGHGDEFAWSDVIAKDGDGGQSAGEGGDRKERCLSSRPEEAHRLHGEDQADSVASKAQQERWSDACGAWKPLAQDKSERQACRSCPKRLRAGDGNGVPQRKALGEVIVDGPAEACPRNRGHSDEIRLAAPSRR